MFRSGQARILPQLKTEKYCVAYLDVLGAKKFMADNSDKFLNDLNSIYFDAKNEVELIGRITSEAIEAKIFSDNILLALKIEENLEKSKDKITMLLCLSANIYNNALWHGYLMRGAITFGDFYQNNLFAYGKALMDAVDMEENIAIYPRIVAHESLYEILQQYFAPCADGCFALKTFLFYGMPDIYKFNLLELCKQHCEDAKVMQKIMWVINYFNVYYSNKAGIKLQITNSEITKAVSSIGSSCDEN